MPMNEQQPNTQVRTVIGIVLIAVILFVVAWKLFAPETNTRNSGTKAQQQSTESAATVTAEPINATAYESAVSALIQGADLANVSQAAQIQVQLVELAVPATYLQPHLQLVDLFQDIQNGESVEALTERMDALQTTYPWLK